MPIVKISLNDTYYQKLEDMAAEAGISIQDVIRNKVFDEEPPQFTPRDAVARIFEQYAPGDRFTLPEVYGDDWVGMKRGVSGVFGRQFFRFVEQEHPAHIRFVGMTDRNRHAQYELIAKP